MKDFPLDSEELAELLELLETARSQRTGGYSFESSPLIPLLEILIDLNLRVAELFREGGRLEDKPNPSIKELDVSDALGNAKMIKIFERPKWAHADPQISFIFRRTAERLVLFKNTGNPLDLATFAVTKFRTINRPPRFKAKEVSSRKETKKNQYWYFKRKARNKSKKI